MRKIIVATSSPRRLALAKTMGLEFISQSSDYEEDNKLALSPRRLVTELAYGKAHALAIKRKKGIVIGVDTLVVYKGIVLGKPLTKNKAMHMLKMLSGSVHYVLTGICLIDIDQNIIIKDYELTKIYFKALSTKEIKAYVKTGQALDKAGAYGLEDLSSIFIRKIEGCYFNALGFPIYKIYQHLQQLNVNILEGKLWKK